MFDIFYTGKKPGLFPHEKSAESIQHACDQSSTRYCWIVNYLSDYSEWDWLWEPVPWQQDFIHVWPSQWHQFSGTYLASRNAKSQYHFHKKVIPNKQCQHNFIALNDKINFDWSWSPHPLDPPYNYIFGNQWWLPEIMPTVKYNVPGAAEIKYMDYPRAQLLEHTNNWHTLVDCKWDYSWQPDPGDPPLIYVFGNQWWPAEKMPTVEYHAPGAVQRKYMSWPRAQLLPDSTKWEVPNNINASDIDFSWKPDPGEPPYIYQFATQHQKTGGPCYIVPGATEIKYLAELKIRTVSNATAIYEIDHMDGGAGHINNTTKRIRYFDNYRDTLIRLAKNVQSQHEYIWVCSSICDYTNFDFSWHPEQWQATMLHVFASDGEKFGDTFFMHVPTFAEYAEKKALLEWYDVNFVDTGVRRKPMPVIKHSLDSQVEAIKSMPFNGPLALYTNNDYVSGNLATVPLWRTETKTVVPLSKGATSVIVPKSAVPYIKTQIYDYAYIDKTRRMLKDHPLDIVFISNGEPYAEFNYEHLKWAVQMEGLDCNHIHHSKGVNGRVAAYQAAARLSTTPWFFAVFAKLEVDHRFDWYWQPDRMQQPKHYIFHAHNPVNGLVYGHQAMIAYNKQMTLENTGGGLDFTMDQLHEVVPIISGTANYTESPWMAWRTAFREVLKLKHSLPDVENEYRLNAWLSDVGKVKNAEWSRFGAEDAVEYYNEVDGDFAALKKSYEWEWLASYVFMRRNLTPDR